MKSQQNFSTEVRGECLGLGIIEMSRCKYKPKTFWCGLIPSKRLFCFILYRGSVSVCGVNSKYIYVFLKHIQV